MKAPPKAYLLMALFLIITSPTGSLALSLEEAIQMALSNHPELRSQRELIQAQTYARKAEGSKRWLRADLVTQAERHSDPVAVVPIKGLGQFPEFSRDIYLWEATVRLPLYEGGRVAQKVRLKELAQKDAWSQLKQSAEDLVANVKQTYYQIVFLQELYTTQEEILKALKEIEKEARLKLRLGKIAKIDLLYLNQEVRAEEAALMSTGKNLRLAQMILALLIGAPSQDLIPNGTLSGENLQPLVVEVEEALERRADVALARIRIEEAKVALSLAKRAYLPQISLFSSYGRRFGAGFNYQEEVWTAGVRLELNLFDSGGRKNLVREKLAQLKAAEEGLRAVRLKARQEILAAQTEIENALLKIKKYRASAAYAQEAFRIEGLKYQTGAGSVIDLLFAQRSWLEAKTALLSARYELLSARIALELASGQIGQGYLQQTGEPK
ncbi:TolC family protein [Thermosulfuriphilus sp.]